MVHKELNERNLYPLLKPYENKWVALPPDKTRVLASGDTLAEVRQKIAVKDMPVVGFMKVVPLDSYYAPSGHEI